MANSVEPRDLTAFEKAVNEAATRANGLWLSFVLFATYLIIAVGSVSHRQLFLEQDLRLPVLGVDLPLVGFFVAAPLFFLIFHFYMFLQIHGLASKVAEYDRALRATVPVNSDRRLIRQRLDSFVFVQLLAGARERREGRIGRLNRIVAWITMAGLPLIALLLAQVVFLPYHLEPVTWLHRAALLFDLLLIHWFWREIMSGQARAAVAGEVRVSLRTRLMRAWQSVRAWQASIVRGSLVPERTKLWRMLDLRQLRGVGRGLGAATSLLLILLSTFVVVSPTETIYPWRWKGLTEEVFEGGVNEVTGRPAGTLRLSNSLVLLDQSFLPADKLKDGKPIEGEVTLSLRDRDLHSAFLSGADLRQADFTGADLRRAKLDRARLQGAKFLCANTGRKDRLEPEGVGPDETPTEYDIEDCAQLQEAVLADADLQGASFSKANLRGANLDGSRLLGASLTAAELSGASLDNADLRGASLLAAAASGTSFDGALLQGASLSSAQLSGASLENVQLQGALLPTLKPIAARISGAFVYRSRTSTNTSSDPARIRRFDLSSSVVKSTDTSPIVFKAKTGFFRRKPVKDVYKDVSAEDAQSLGEFLRKILDQVPEARKEAVNGRLDRLRPSFQTSDMDHADAQFWMDAQRQSEPFSEDAYQQKLAQTLATLICEIEPASDSPHVAKGLDANGRIGALGPHLSEFIKKIEQPTDCPGAAHIEPNFMSDLRKREKEEKASAEEQKPQF
jgi:uncharacterized protein YjbI with pentapeptide repeats